MKKILAIILSVLMLFGLCACKAPGKADGKISIVTTIFPVYDWVREIVGDNDDVEITMLLDSGVDLHSYSPTVSDMATIASCDMFVYIGGESDDWVKDALKQKQNDDMVIIDLMDALGDAKRAEELKEGMQEEEAEEEDEEEIEYDEHIWLSVKNAGMLCDVIRVALCTMDKDNSKKYTNNAMLYKAKLIELDYEYEQLADNASVKSLIFCDRFPFKYLVDDYGIDYYAAFKGCSTESNASAKTIKFLIDKLDELNLKYVIKIEGSKDDLAKTVISNSKSKSAEILTLNSMQSVTSSQVSDGVTYTELCRENLEVLKKALG